MGRVAVLTQVEELPDNQVRLSVEVPAADVKHAVEHAADDLAASLKIPGFRKGKVPKPVLLARVGRERVMAEAVESHIGGWYRNAVASSRVMPVAQPHYDYEVPASETTRGHGTTGEAKYWKHLLPELLNGAPVR